MPSFFQKRILSPIQRINPNIAAYITLAVIVGMYACIEIAHFTPAYQEVDPDGYLILAKRMARGGPLAVKADDPFMYQTHVWVENKNGEVAPKFAPGYPALMAIAYLLGGDRAMFFVSPIMGGLALVGMFFLFRLWMSRLAALAATFCMAANGMILVYSGYLLTHASNLCCVVWGMFFLWRWIRGIGRFSEVGAGLLLGAAVTMRHTSFLLVAVPAMAIGVKWYMYLRDREAAKQPRRDTILLLASYSFLPFLMMIYNWVIFDSPFITGYGLSGEQDAFALGNIIKNARMLTTGLNFTGLFFLFPLGLAGIFLAGSRGESLMRLLWFAPIFILYSSYYWAPGGKAYYRFLIVTFPVIAGSAFALMDKVTQSWLRKFAVFILLLSFLVFITYNESKAGLKGTVSDPRSRSLAASAERVSKILDNDAAIFSRSPIFCYMGTRRDFYLYDLNIFTASYGAGSFKEGVTPRRHPKRSKRFLEFYKGLTDADLQKKKQELIQGFLAHGRQTAYLLPKHAVKAEQSRLGKNMHWELLDEWGIYSKIVSGAWQTEDWGLYEINGGTEND